MDITNDTPTPPDDDSRPAHAHAQRVHFQFNADIPAGTRLRVTVEASDSTGKTATLYQQDNLDGTLQVEREVELAYHPADTVPADTVPVPFWERPARAVPSRSGERAALWARLRSLLARYSVPVLFRDYFLLAALAIYALAIGYGIQRFPIYFFTDEAIHMNMASDFIRDGFQNYYKEFLPTFFSIEGWVNGTSVYVQVLPFLLFGKSILATRLVSAFITLLGALALGLLLKQVYKIKYYWAGIFLLLTTPAWFLHARTAFEYAEVASFYAIFLYFYARYRSGDLPYLYAAVIAAALTFYTHGLGQILISVTGLALFLVDIRYHLAPERRKTLLYALILALILLLPFARYYLAHSGEAAAQIKRRGSYWANANLSTLQKMGELLRQYAYGLNPRYWYLPNTTDLARHVMKGYGNGLWITFPLVLLGLLRATRSGLAFTKQTPSPSAPYRMALIALLAAPLPASVVAIGMPRMLWMAVPLAILAAIGLSWYLELLEARFKTLKKLPVVLPWVTFLLLSLLSGTMLRDALVNGPTWFEDYGLYGMQYGAQQVFGDTAAAGLQENPERIYVISPSWANGTEKFADFFIPEGLLSHVIFGQPINMINRADGFTPNTRFIITVNEYNALLADPKFTDLNILKIIPYPNGKPGFYELTLRPADNIQAILAAEKEKNRAPIEETMQLSGQQVRAIHSPFGSGSLEAVFDLNPDSLARVLEANPFIFDLYPTTPLDTHSVDIQTGALPDFTVTISLYAPGASSPVTYTRTFKDLPPDPKISMSFDQGPAQSARITIEIKDNISGETSQIHVRTIAFK